MVKYYRNIRFFGNIFEDFWILRSVGACHDLQYLVMFAYNRAWPQGPDQEGLKSLKNKELNRDY